MFLVFPSGYSASRAGSVQDADGAVIASDGKKVAVSVMPELIEQLPAGCSAVGAGTAEALQIGPYE